MRLVQRHQLHEAAIFIATPLKKHIEQLILPKVLSIFKRKVLGLNAKIFSACWRHKRGFHLFLTYDDKIE